MLVGWLVGSGEPCFQGRPMRFSRILMPPPYPTAGLCPETFHLDLVIPPEGDSIQVLAAVSFGSANANAELPGKGFGPPCNMCLFSSPPAGATCSPMGGNGCRAIHSRYCGGKLHFNQNVSSRTTSKLCLKLILAAPFFLVSKQAMVNIPICGRWRRQ